MVEKKSSNGKRMVPTLAFVLAIFLILVTVSLFSYFGYQSVIYLLAKMFNATDNTSTIYDFFIGLVSIVGSVFVFIGSVHVFRLKTSVPKLFVWGSSFFLLKNVLDIINDIQPLRSLETVSFSDVSEVAWSIGADFLQVAFWIFVVVYFNRASFKSMLK